jgi:hypothetical protein
MYIQTLLDQFEDYIDKSEKLGLINSQTVNAQRKILVYGRETVNEMKGVWNNTSEKTKLFYKYTYLAWFYSETGEPFVSCMKKVSSPKEYVQAINKYKPETKWSKPYTKLLTLFPNQQ